MNGNGELPPPEPREGEAPEAEDDQFLWGV
jgi:hypothetical protein